MFLNVITEEQIRRECPHNAPLTLRAFNKISPRQFNTSVSPLNPYEIPRYAPKTVGQFAKALVSQQRGSMGQPTNALAVAATQEAILAETQTEDYVIDYGDEVKVEELVEEDIRTEPEEEEPLTRRKKPEMMEARAMGAEDLRTIERKEEKLRRKEARREKTRQQAAYEQAADLAALPDVPKPSQRSKLRGAIDPETQYRLDDERLRKMEADKGINYGGGADKFVSENRERERLYRERLEQERQERQFGPSYGP